MLKQLLAERLAPSVDGDEPAGEMPSVEEFARSWFDPRRFDGLPLRRGL